MLRRKCVHCGSTLHKANKCPYLGNETPEQTEMFERTRRALLSDPEGQEEAAIRRARRRFEPQPLPPEKKPKHRRKKK